jgi:hypothetical protein
VGVGAQGQQYFLSGGGPPYRDIANSGVVAGAGTDGTMICPLTPWATLSYMVTGRDVTGALINAGQTLTRMEALEMYTRGSSWFTHDDDEVGSIEIGKLADLVVLSDDYLTVPEIEIRSISSVLTVVGGKIVHVDSGISPWTYLEGGTVGSNGLPTLLGSGPLSANSLTSVSLMNAPANALMLFWISLSSNPFGAIGGTVWTVPANIDILLFADPSGNFEASGLWPPGLPPGIEIWFQMAVEDVSVIYGITLSNGLKATTP